MAGARDPHSDRPDETWMVRFKAGDVEVLSEVYREHFAILHQTVSYWVSGADADNVVHDVFYKLISRQEVREGYRGGALGAWLKSMAKNQAIDYLRRYRREHLTNPEDTIRLADRNGVDPGSRAREDVLLETLIKRFRFEVLPPKWAPVFDARFLRELSQHEAAAYLSMRRTTLAYQEIRIRRLFKSFIAKMDAVDE
ncbi:MAG: sigma-70 family RNA polymerase sigma factor [Myxococcota bacterium]